MKARKLVTTDRQPKQHIVCNTLTPDNVPTPMTSVSTRASRVNMGPSTAMPRPTFTTRSSWQRPKQHCSVSILNQNNTPTSPTKQQCNTSAETFSNCIQPTWYPHPQCATGNKYLTRIYCEQTLVEIDGLVSTVTLSSHHSWICMTHDRDSQMCDNMTSYHNAAGRSSHIHSQHVWKIWWSSAVWFLRYVM